jgi:hypothetical protein
MRQLSVVALTSAVALSTVGCGLGDSRPLTRSELIRRADAICYGVDVMRDETTIKRLSDYQRLMPALGAYEEQALAKLEQLDAPTGLDGQWKQMLAKTRVAADETSRIALSVSSRKYTAAEHELANVSSSEKQSALIGASVGFQYCSRVET